MECDCPPSLLVNFNIQMTTFCCQDIEQMTSAIIHHLISLITSGPSPVVRVTLSNLIMFYLHGNAVLLAHNRVQVFTISPTGRDNVQKLKSKYVSSVADYHWQKNLRFYWNDDEIEGLGHLSVAMVTSVASFCRLLEKLVISFKAGNFGPVRIRIHGQHFSIGAHAIYRERIRVRLETWPKKATK